MAINSTMNRAVLNEARRIASRKLAGERASALNESANEQVRKMVNESSEAVAITEDEIKDAAEAAAAKVFGEGYEVNIDGSDVVVSLDPNIYFAIMEGTYNDGKPCYVAFYAPMISIEYVGEGEYNAISNLEFEDYIILDAESLEVVADSVEDDADEVLDVVFDAPGLYLIEDKDVCPDSCAIASAKDIEKSFKDFIGVLCVDDQFKVLSQINFESDIEESDVKDLDAETGESIGDAVTSYLIEKGYISEGDFDGGEAATDEPVEDDAMAALESVSQKFAKHRRIYEDVEDVSEDDKNKDGGSDDELFAAIDAGLEAGKDESDEKKSDDGDNDSDENSEDDEDKELDAVEVTVKAGFGNKCKDEMIDAGVAEEDIEVIEGDEEDTIRVSAYSVMELKEYLSGKGIDLEEKIGEIVVDDDIEDGDDEKSDDEKSDDEKSGEENADGDSQEPTDDDFKDLFA